MKRIPFFWYLILSSFMLFHISEVSAHTGHPEDQLIDGVDNELFAYIAILLILVAVIVAAYLQGKRAIRTNLNY